MGLAERIVRVLLRGTRRSVVSALTLLTIAVLGWLTWNACVRPAPLRIAADTTLITEPLASDGLPDYSAYLREREHQGVTAEYNGAIQFWKAMGPAEIPAEYRDAFFTELGCPIPSADEALQPLHSSKEYAEWLGRLEAAGSGLATRLKEAASTRRLGSGGHRLLAPWIAEQAGPIDRLVRASEQPRFYSPPPNWIGDQTESVMAGLLVDEQSAKQAILALTTRAGLAIQQGDRKKAWNDLTAADRIACFYDRPQVLVTTLVATDLHSRVNRSLILYLSACEKADEVSGTLRYLLQGEEYDGVDEAMEIGETIMLLDAILEGYIRDSSDIGIVWRLCPPDRNVMFRYVRSWLDQYAEVAGMEDRLARRDAAEALETAITKVEQEVEVRGRRWLSLLFSPAARGELLARIHVSNMMPAIQNVVLVEDRCVTVQRLAILTAALKLHRIRDGLYPESLGQLVPKSLEAIPLDPFTNEPFRYERRGDGFVLYSLGVNGEDDGGSDADGDFIDGEHAPIDWLDERPKPRGPDDLVVRLPIPELELPPVDR